MKKVYAILIALCCVISTNAQEKNNYKKFAGGFELGSDFGSRIFGIHVGGTARYGHYSNLFNLTAGINFNLNQAYHGQDEGIEYHARASTIGGQLTIPVIAKFNVLKCTERTRFYVGAGAEAGFKIYAKDLYFDWDYKYYSVMNEFSIAGLLQAGVAGARFDAGIYYKHYFNDLVHDKFPGYQQRGRIGFNLAYYF